MLALPHLTTTSSSSSLAAALLVGYLAVGTALASPTTTSSTSVTISPTTTYNELISISSISISTEETNNETATAPGNQKIRRGWLGGVEMPLACVLQHGDSWAAVSVGSSCVDWKCKKGLEETNINMDAACVAQYELLDARPKCEGDAWSWTCYLG